MPNNIILKKSSTNDKVPLPGDLQYGELALNFADGNLFYKTSANAITTIASNKFVSVTGNVTGGNIITGGLISATGNITGGNLRTGGQVSATGTITGGNLNVSGNAAAGILLNVTDTAPAGSSKTVNIIGGTNGLAVVANITNGSYNSLQSTGDIALLATGATIGNVGFSIIPWAGANSGIRMNTVSNVTSITLAATTVSITGATVNTGNITGGNILTAGLISATGNITGGNITTADSTFIRSGRITLTSNALGGFLYQNDNSPLYLGANTANVANASITIAGGTAAPGNVTVSSNLAVTGNVTGSNFVGNGSTLSNIDAFGTIVVAGQSNVVANSSSGTLTLVGGTGITINTNAATDTITITAQDQNSGIDIFQTGGSMGLVTSPVTSQGDLGLVSQVASSLINMGTIVLSGLVYPTEFKLPSYTVTGLPSASALGLMIFVTNATGGSVPAFSDGTNWRSVVDRSIIT